MTEFDYSILTPEDRDIAIEIVGCTLPHPPVILAPDGEPYLYRWHVVYNNLVGNVFFHVQVKSDPERPLHDHPWANTSVILSGGYDEIYQPYPELVPKGIAAGGEEDRTALMRSLRKGDSAYRAATTAHRLIMPKNIPYTMTLFSTGPKSREWGFWYPDGWHHNKQHVDDRPNDSSVRMISIGHH